MVLVGIFSGASLLFAEDHYAVSVHKTVKGFTMTTMTAFDDAEACRDTASDRSAAMSEEWQPVISDCLGSSQMTEESLKISGREPGEHPYLAFLDENGLKNTVIFTEVPPVMLDAFLLKWQSELKKQGMKDVVIVTDPKKHKLLDLVGKTKARLAGKPEDKESVLEAALAAAGSEPAEEAAPPAEPAGVPAQAAEPVQPAMIKRDRLVLQNGQTVRGQILERREEGIWFRLDEGVEMLFTRAEIKQEVTE